MGDPDRVFNLQDCIDQQEVLNPSHFGKVLIA